MNYGRWVVVLLVAASMGISASILLIPGEKYQILTTSDSGWVYNIAVRIENTNALADKVPISHAPYGLDVETYQLQSLGAVVLYRAAHAVNPSVTLMDVAKYWGPLIFAIAIIPVFLAARELGGNTAGCAAAFLMATMTRSIYWHKVGAFDREPTQILFIALTLYFTIKLFKASKKDVWKFSILAGMSTGLFGMTWGGWIFIMAPFVGGVMFILLHEFAGHLVHRKFDIFAAVSSAIKVHLKFLLGVLGMAVVVSIALWSMTRQEPISMWTGFFQMMLSYVGISFGGGGVGSITPPATEAQLAGPLSQTLDFYDSGLLGPITLVLLSLAVLKFVWSRKKWELLMVAWFIILLAMVWPGKGQARFDRVWWPFYAMMAGAGVAVVMSLIKKLSTEWQSGWLDHLHHPLLLTILAVFIGSAFLLNAKATAAITTPPTQWHGYPLYDGFIEASSWIGANTTPDNVFSIQWSFGHFFTGTNQRPTVCDGSDTTGKEGAWETLPGIPKPPDYIYYVEGNQARRYGIEAYQPYGKSYFINGRRVDVQRFPVIGKDELKWYLKTYRDNYGVKIDYLVFTYDEYAQSANYPANILLGKERLASLTQAPTSDNTKLILNFGDNRSAVVLDSATQSVYLQVGSSQLTMDGYGIMGVAGNSISDYRVFVPPAAPAQINETLVLFVDSSNPGTIVGAWLVTGASNDIAQTPVSALAWTQNLAGVDYLQTAFTSSDSMVKLLRVDHSLVT
ncbi:MAG: STT3 domain-containing protein [Candidatus Hadarchaeota archaeon]